MLCVVCVWSTRHIHFIPLVTPYCTTVPLSIFAARTEQQLYRLLACPTTAALSRVSKTKCQLVLVPLPLITHERKTNEAGRSETLLSSSVWYRYGGGALQIFQELEEVDHISTASSYSTSLALEQTFPVSSSGEDFCVIFSSRSLALYPGLEDLSFEARISWL